MKKNKKALMGLSIVRGGGKGKKGSQKTTTTWGKKYRIRRNARKVEAAEIVLFGVLRKV